MAHLDSAKWVSCTNCRGSGIKHLTLQKGNHEDSQGRKESLPQGLCKLMSLVLHTSLSMPFWLSSTTWSHFRTNDGSLIQCFLDNLHTWSSWDLGVNFKRTAKHNVTDRNREHHNLCSETRCRYVFQGWTAGNVPPCLSHQRCPKRRAVWVVQAI